MTFGGGKLAKISTTGIMDASSLLDRQTYLSALGSLRSSSPADHIVESIFNLELSGRPFGRGWLRWIHGLRLDAERHELGEMGTYRSVVAFRAGHCGCVRSRGDNMTRTIECTSARPVAVAVAAGRELLEES